MEIAHEGENWGEMELGRLWRCGWRRFGFGGRSNSDLAGKAPAALLFSWGKRKKKGTGRGTVGFGEQPSEEWTRGGPRGEAVVPLQDHIAACHDGLTAAQVQAWMADSFVNVKTAIFVL
jgi:hypothetical protein